jgi:hypothetical protein
MRHTLLVPALLALACRANDLGNTESQYKAGLSKPESRVIGLGAVTIRKGHVPVADMSATSDLAQNTFRRDKPGPGDFTVMSRRARSEGGEEGFETAYVSAFSLTHASRPFQRLECKDDQSADAAIYSARCMLRKMQMPRSA